MLLKSTKNFQKPIIEFTSEINYGQKGQKANTLCSHTQKRTFCRDRKQNNNEQIITVTVCVGVNNHGQALGLCSSLLIIIHNYYTFYKEPEECSLKICITKK